jgi:hypothetical protein
MSPSRPEPYSVKAGNTAPADRPPRKQAMPEAGSVQPATGRSRVRSGRSSQHVATARRFGD